MKPEWAGFIGALIGITSAFYVFAVTFNYPFEEAVDDLVLSILISGVIVGLVFKGPSFKAGLIGFLFPWGFVLGLWLIAAIEAIAAGEKFLGVIGIILLTGSALVVIPSGVAYFKSKYMKRHEDS